MSRANTARAVVVSLGLLLVVGATGRAFAAPAAASHLAQLGIQIWPEYDRASALVMLDIEVAPPAKPPVVVAVTIPAAAGKPHAVAQRGEDGKLYVANYATATQGDWTTVTVTSDRPALHVEYYAPLQVKASERRFSFSWPGAPRIDKVSFAVQSPKAATKLATTPPAGKLAQDSRGLTIHVGELGAHAAGQPLTLQLSYENPSGALTAPAVAAAPSSPSPAQGAAPGPPPVAAPSEPSSKGRTSGKLLWIVMLVGALVGVGFAVATHRRGNGEQPRG